MVKLEEIEDILICPKTGHALVKDRETFKIAFGYEGHMSGVHYKKINGQPVFVDFKRSILSEQEVFSSKGSSTINRKENKLRTLLKNVFLRPGMQKKNIIKADKFIKILKSKTKKPLVLIIGGGSKGIGANALYDDPDVRVVSFDIYTSSLTNFIADAHSIPLKAESIDGVWIQYVLEHVLNPWHVVSEIYRVLHKEGAIYSEVPFMQQVHEGAYDFTRFTQSGLRWLFRYFREIDSGIGMGPGVAFLWTIENLARSFFRSRKIGQAVKLSFFWVQFFEILIPESYKIDNASSYYFLGQKDDSSIQPSDILKYYKGAL